MRLERLRNGALLQVAESEGSEVLITKDQSMPFQQNMTGRRIAIVAISENKWPIMQNRIAEIIAALVDLEPGDVKEIPI